MAGIFGCFRPRRSRSAPRRVSSKQPWYRAIFRALFRRPWHADEDGGLMYSNASSDRLRKYISVHPNKGIAYVAERHPAFAALSIAPVETTSSIDSSATLVGNANSFDAEYEQIYLLNHNNQGPLHLVCCRSTREQCIIKQNRCRFVNGAPMIPREALIAGQVGRHRNICGLKEVLIDEPRGVANMVFPFCSGGDVANFVDAINGPAPETFVLHFAASMIDALAYLHNGHVADARSLQYTKEHGHRAVVHRDIKPGNIFMSHDSKNTNGLPTILIGDFGCAALCANNVGTSGTEGYMAPEVVSHFSDHEFGCSCPDICTKAGDMYAFGVSLYEVTTGNMYDSSLTRAEITARFAVSNVANRPEVLWIIQQCISSNPSDRPVVADLYDDAFVFRQRVRKWYDAGGRIDANIWPDPFKSDKKYARSGPEPVIAEAARWERSGSNAVPRLKGFTICGTGCADAFADF